VTANPPLTMVISHPAADQYAALIGARFPQVRTIAALDQAVLERHIGEAEALLAFRFPVELFNRARKLRWFQSTGAGVDSMFTLRERADHITVTNARGIHGDLIADYVMGGIAVLHWDFRAFLREQADKKWNFRMVSPLADKSLGVIGLGSVGSTIARRAKSAGMTVLGTRRNASQPVQGVDQLFAADALKEMLPFCDFVVVAVPSTSETVGLLGAAEFACMRRTAFLLNVARGSVIVENELIDALQAGTIAGAMLDVFECEPLPQDSPLWTMPNVIVTPHVSGMPTEYVQRAFAIVAENIERFLSGRALMNVVDLRRGY